MEFVWICRYLSWFHAQETCHWRKEEGLEEEAKVNLKTQFSFLNFIFYSDFFFLVQLWCCLVSEKVERNNEWGLESSLLYVLFVWKWKWFNCFLAGWDGFYRFLLYNLKRPFFTMVISLYVCFLYDLWAQFDSDRK